MTPKTNAEYVACSDHCPYCNSEHLQGKDFTVEGAWAFQEVGCNDCNGSWYDEYQLTGYVAINTPPEKPE